jgi:hypothetical protein
MEAIRYDRTARRFPLRFKLIYDDGVSYSAGFVEDISETGMFVEGSDHPPPGTVVRLDVVDASAEALAGKRARVVHAARLDPFAVDPREQDGAVGFGLEFLGLTDADRVQIRDLIERLTDQRVACRDPYLAIRAPGAPPRAA